MTRSEQKAHRARGSRINLLFILAAGADEYQAVDRVVSGEMKSTFRSRLGRVNFTPF
jgi:hypothetical protein